MVHRILMHIVQPSEVTMLMGQMSLSVVLPKPRTPRRPISPIQLFRSQTVQLLDHLS